MSHENNDYIQQLRAKGYRVTPQRLIVLDAVCEVGGHATIGAICARVKMLDPTIDPSTVYRALDVLCDAELIVVADMGDEGKIYNIADEAGHHHLHCQSCGAVLTIDTVHLDSLRDSLQEQYGFVLQSEHLVLSGLCADCVGKSHST